MVKIVVDLSGPFVDLKGKQIEYDDGDKPVLADRLAMALINSQEKNSIKLWDWSIDLHKNKKIEIEEADFKYLEDFVEKAETLRVLDKGQILKALSKCKDKADRRAETKKEN